MKLQFILSFSTCVFLLTFFTLPGAIGAKNNTFDDDTLKAADALIEDEDFEHARSSLQKLILEKPREWRYWKRYYNVLTKLDKPGMATVSLERAVEFCQDSTEEKKVLASELEKLKTEEEEALAKKFPQSKGQQEIKGEFKYFFYESTGQNQFVEAAGERFPICFDDSGSNEKELDALRSLGWPVLYPNSKGKIILLGELSKKRTAHKFGMRYPEPPGAFYHNFKLKHWYLPVPFERGIVGGDIPSIQSLEKATSLKEKDFNEVPDLPLSHFTSK